MTIPAIQLFNSANDLTSKGKEILDHVANFLKSYPDKKVATQGHTDNRVAGGFSPPAPTPPGMRVRTGRFTEITGP